MRFESLRSESLHKIVPKFVQIRLFSSDCPFAGKAKVADTAFMRILRPEIAFQEEAPAGRFVRGIGEHLFKSLAGQLLSAAI